MQDTILYVAAAALLLSAAFIAIQQIRIKSRDHELELHRGWEKLLHGLTDELRDTWDHLPRFVPMAPAWGRLAQEIGYALPRIVRYSRELGHDPADPLLDPVYFGASGFAFREVEELVREIDDPTLSDLWASRRPIDLVMILRLALFKTWQPGFDLSPLYVERQNDQQA